MRYQVIQNKLRIQYSKALKQMRSLKYVGSSAPLDPVKTLKKSKSVFLKYRKSTCTWVAASYASGNGSGQATLQCQIKITKQYCYLLKSYA